MRKLNDKDEYSNSAVKYYRGYVKDKNADPNGDNKVIDNTDALSVDYSLRENSLLTTVSVFLFAFLLNTALNLPKSFSYVDILILTIAIFSITIAVSLFVMPVVYHHAQYPYTDIEKLKKRNHRFTMYGLVPAAVTLYLGLELGIDLALRISPSYVLVDRIAFLLAAIPFVLVFILYKKRK
jgi:hypothetical protein